MAGRLTTWFEEQIKAARVRVPDGAIPGLGSGQKCADSEAQLLELEGLRDEARRLEGAGDGTATAQAGAGDPPEVGLGLSNGNGTDGDGRGLEARATDGNDVDGAGDGGEEAQ